MSGQDAQTLADPMFEALESWQKENPVRRRITSEDLPREHGNFVTFCGRFRRKRSASRGPRGDNVNDFQLADARGTVFIRPTRFISKEDIKQVYY